MAGLTPPRLRGVKSPARKRHTAVVAVLLSAGAVIALGGCSTSAATSNNSSRSSSVPKPSIKPTFSPAGTAEDNIAYFRSLFDEAIAKEGLNASTEKLAKAVAGAGFDPAGIQYSDNATAVGMKPDSVTVAVTFKGKCLIAQFGSGVGGLDISVQPVLASGGCLLGRSLNHL